MCKFADTIRSFKWIEEWDIFVQFSPVFELGFVTLKQKQEEHMITELFEKADFVDHGQWTGRCVA